MFDISHWLHFFMTMHSGFLWVKYNSNNISYIRIWQCRHYMKEKNYIKNITLLCDFKHCGFIQKKIITSCLGLTHLHLVRLNSIAANNTIHASCLEGPAGALGCQGKFLFKQLLASVHKTTSIPHKAGGICSVHMASVLISVILVLEPIVNQKSLP